MTRKERDEIMCNLHQALRLMQERQEIDKELEGIIFKAQDNLDEIDYELEALEEANSFDNKT